MRVFILAGGRGERFWPLSRRSRPKPLLDLGSGRSLLRETLRRATRVASPQDTLVVTGPQFARAIQRELRGRESRGILVEPASRNTGPASLLATRAAWVQDPRCEVLILPSDHRVTGLGAFRRAVATARSLARRGFLVTFGVQPEGPESDFGYIVPGKALGRTAFRVRRFVEKPEAPRARRLLRRDATLWNSGMFVWRADVFLEEAARCAPAFGRWLRIAGGARGLSRAARAAFRALPEIPVDRAVMERSPRVAVVKADFGWSDLGSWSSFYSLRPRDRRGNASWGRMAALDARGNLAVHPGGLVVLVGVDELLVVCSRDLVLVCPRARAAGMREIVRDLGRAGFRAYL